MNDRRLEGKTDNGILTTLFTISNGRVSVMSVRVSNQAAELTKEGEMRKGKLKDQLTIVFLSIGIVHDIVKKGHHKGSEGEVILCHRVIEDRK